MKIAYWPDTHLRYNILDDFLHHNYDKFDKVVLTGDFFDDHYDTVEANLKMARFLKFNILYDDKFIVIPGNHDNYYRWGHKNELILGSGFSEDKSKVINSILDEEDWNKFANYTYFDGWLASHAGFSPKIFGDKGKFNLKDLDDILKRGYELIRAGEYNEIFAASPARGGRAQAGGPFWQCWSEIEPVTGFNQIVGHTRQKRPKIKFYNSMGILVNRDYHNDAVYPRDELCVCLDTNNNYFGIVTDGKLTVHRTKLYTKKNDY